MYYLQLHYGQVKKYLNFKGENNFGFLPLHERPEHIYLCGET